MVIQTMSAVVSAVPNPGQIVEVCGRSGCGVCGGAELPA